MGLKVWMVEEFVLDEEQAGCFSAQLRQVQDDVELPPRKKCPVERHGHCQMTLCHLSYRKSRGQEAHIHEDLQEELSGRKFLIGYGQIWTWEQLMVKEQ